MTTMDGKPEDYGATTEAVANENTDAVTNPDDTAGNKRNCCDIYNGNTDAIGYTWLAIGRGALVMSNIMISSSILWLASDAAGCFDDDKTADSACTKRIYGFVPSSFISNIAVVSGLVAAFLMPILGAYVDFTPHRRRCGIISASIMVVIQAIQIYTVPSTWFAMAFLQAAAIVFYQFQIVSIFAYMPEIARQVGEEEMTRFSAYFTGIQFLAQASFLLVIAVVRIAFLPSVVMTGQISQGINTVTSLVFFSLGWFKYMSPRPAVHKLPPGASLLTVGFREVWNTAKTIQRHFKKGLRWFFLALCFAEASAAAITTISVIYLNDTLKMNPTEIAIFYLVTLIGCLPGAYFGLVATRKSNPNTSWKISMIYLFVVLVIGALVLEDLNLAYVYFWGFCVGIGLGWFYSTENLFFSMILPKGQEAELAGFYVYCSQILVWLPPLLFTLCVENSVDQKYGLIITTIFFVVAASLLMCTAPWDEIVEEAAAGIVTLGEGDGYTRSEMKNGQNE